MLRCSSPLGMDAKFAWRDARPSLELTAEMRIGLVSKHHRNMVNVQVCLF